MKTLYNLIPLVLIFIFANALTGCEEDTVETVDVEISLNKDELVLEIGESERLEASFYPMDAPNTAHMWSSQNELVATVDETGMVKAVNKGSTVITAKALSGGKMARCYVQVVGKKVPVSGISLDKTECTIAVGNTIRLHATVKPTNATNQNVKWLSEDTGIATVDNNGEISGISAGTVNIKAITEDGNKTATCKVVVESKGVKMSVPEIANVTSSSAYVTGSINPVGVEIESMGICYANKPNPTIYDERITLTNTNISYNLKYLKAGTTYYIRFYAIVAGKAMYSDQSVFETLAEVDFSALTFGSITSSTAVIKGKIQGNGSELEEMGFVYSKNQTPTITNDKVCVSSEEFEYTLYELEANTQYYVRLYALVNGQTYYGEENHFVTNEELYTNFVTWQVYSDKLVLLSDVPKGYEMVNVCYGTSPNPKVTDNVAVAKLGTDGKLELELTNLTSSTYYIRSYEKMGSTFKYSDDEVCAMTLWKGYSHKTGHSKVEGQCSFELDLTYGDDPKQRWIKISYKNLPDGVYEVFSFFVGSSYADNQGMYFCNTKKGNYQKEIYIEGGEGEFYVDCYLGANVKQNDYIIRITSVEHNRWYDLERLWQY